VDIVLEKIKIPLLVGLGIVLVVVLARAFMGGKAPAAKVDDKKVQTSEAKPKTGVAKPPAAKEGEPQKDDNISDSEVLAIAADIGQEPFTYDPLVVDAAGQKREKRNPMKSPMATESISGEGETFRGPDELSSTEVRAIVWDERFPVAIVRNAEGATLEERKDRCIYVGYAYADNITVKSIERDRVVFKIGDSEYESLLRSGAPESDTPTTDVKQ